MLKNVFTIKPATLSSMMGTTESDLNHAAYMFRCSLLQEMEDQPDVAKMDVLKSTEERDREKQWKNYTCHHCFQTHNAYLWLLQLRTV